MCKLWLIRLLFQVRQLRDTIPRMIDPLIQKQPSRMDSRPWLLQLHPWKLTCSNHS